MKLYSGTSEQFISDAVRNQIAEKLVDAFFHYYRYYPSINEKRAWQNSLNRMSELIQYSELMDHGVILEYQLPQSSKRLDFLICGKNEFMRDHAIIVELKQWEKCQASEGDNEVITYVGGDLREILHPSAQVGHYEMYLRDTHTSFYGDHAVELEGCSYLHNYKRIPNDCIFSEKFKPILLNNPIFTADDVDTFIDYLKIRLNRGEGVDILKRIEQSQYRPSKQLMQHVGNIIKNKSDYILLDEQLIVYDKVILEAKKGFHSKDKTIIVIKGGPGTGKSVIALNLMADLLLKDYNAHYATGSKAFTETLRKKIGTRGSVQFKYFNSYSNAEYNEIDVLICDEAHRLRYTSNNRFTPKAKRSNLAQIEEIIKASKVSVFFIDDNQTVRPNEIGSAEYIEEYADKKDCDLFVYELDIQFRCSGSEGFINWLNNTLQIKKTANVIWNAEQEDFDFRIVDSPQELEKMIREKEIEGFTARVVAGFCWDWSDPGKDGMLVNDVKIGEYRRPWNAKPNARRIKKEIPKASLWATDPNGINQIGCIYTAQGFEFDYAGVIFGNDLVYRFSEQGWVAVKQNSADGVVRNSKEKLSELLKNTYRVLLSRGLKGCYVYFMDKETENFVKTRIELE